MIRDYEIEYSENGIQMTKEEKPKTNLFQELIDKNYKVYQDYIMFASIVKKYLKVKGDMMVMQKVSRKKNKDDFIEMEKFLNDYQRQH